MQSTLTLSRQHSYGWTRVVLFVVAVIATVALAIAVFGSFVGDPASPAMQTTTETPVAEHDLCSFAGARRMGC